MNEKSEEKYILMQGNNQYKYEDVNQRHPNKIVIDKNIIEIEEYTNGKIKEIKNETSRVKFLYAQAKAQIEYYEQNILVKKVTLELDESDGTIKIKKYNMTTLIDELTFSNYHVIEINNKDYEHLLEFDNEEKIIKYTKTYRIEGKEEKEEVEFSYEEKISKIRNKEKERIYKYNERNKIETIKDENEIVRQYEYLGNNKISSINEIIFKASIINKQNLLIQEEDNKENKYGYTCIGNTQLDTLSSKTKGINFTLKSEGVKIGQRRIIANALIRKEIEYQGNEKDTITITFKYKFLNIGTTLGNYKLEMFKEGILIQTYNFTFDKNKIKENEEGYIIKTIRIEKPCDKVKLEINIIKLTSAIIYNPSITETNNEIRYTYENEKVKSIIRGNDFSNYYYDDNNKKEIIQFDLDSNLNNYGQNKEGYINSIQNAYGQINGKTYDEGEENGHQILEKGEYFNNTYINEQYHYDGKYINKIKDENGTIKEVMTNPLTNEIIRITSLKQEKGYEYNTYGQVIRQITAKEDKSNEIKYEYNTKHLLSKIILSNNSKYEFNYNQDSLQLLSKVTFEQKELVNYEYDKYKLKKEKCGGEQKAKTFYYDDKDNLIEVKYGTDTEEQSLFRYEYDEINRLIKIKDMDDETKSISIDYDINGNIIEIGNDEKKTNYTYEDGILINTRRETI